MNKTTETPQDFKPVILITGCGSGLGRALAELFFEASEYRVVVTAREKSLPELRARFKESERFWIRSLDILDENLRTEIVKEIDTAWGGVSVLINNAGISYRACLEHMSERDEFHQMSTNYFAPVGLIRAVLPGMRAIGRGKIINVSSVSGMLAMPTMASYSASKYALEGVSEALWYELKPLGINVSLIQPGFIHSDSFKNVYYTELSNPNVCIDGTYCDYYENMTPFVERLMRRSRSTPKRIAEIILKVVKKQNPQLWIPVTIDALLFYYLRRILPRRLLLPILFFALPNARSWGKAYSKRRFL